MTRLHDYIIRGRKVYTQRNSSNVGSSLQSREIHNSYISPDMMPSLGTRHTFITVASATWFRPQLTGPRAAPQSQGHEIVARKYHTRCRKSAAWLGRRERVIGVTRAPGK